MSDEIKIEKGVDLPEIGSRKGKYPFESMAFGDFFFVAESGDWTCQQIKMSIDAAARRFEKKCPGVKMKAVIMKRESPEGQLQGVGCKRIS